MNFKLDKMKLARARIKLAEDLSSVPGAVKPTQTPTLTAHGGPSAIDSPTNSWKPELNHAGKPALFSKLAPKPAPVATQTEPPIESPVEPPTQDGNNPYLEMAGKFTGQIAAENRLRRFVGGRPFEANLNKGIPLFRPNAFGPTPSGKIPIPKPSPGLFSRNVARAPTSLLRSAAGPFITPATIGVNAIQRNLSDKPRSQWLAEHDEATTPYGLNSAGEKVNPIIDHIGATFNAWNDPELSAQQLIKHAPNTMDNISDLMDTAGKGPELDKQRMFKVNYNKQQLLDKVKTVGYSGLTKGELNDLYNWSTPSQ